MKQILRNLIAEGKTEQAIVQLRALKGLDNAVTIEIDLLSGRFQGNEHQKRLGISDVKITQTETISINNALLLVIDRLDEAAIVAQNLAPNTNILRGGITTKGEGDKPLRGVNIGIVGTRDKTYTDEQGYYEIACSGKSVGDDVSLIVEKDGYVVLDTNALKEVMIRKDPTRLFNIVMQAVTIRESEIENATQNIIANIIRVSEEQKKVLEDRLKALEASQTTTMTAIERTAYHHQIQRLDQEKGTIAQDRDRTLALARETAEKLTIFDATQASEEAKRANALFLEGDLIGAYNALDEDKMQHRAQAAQALIAQTISDYMQKGNLAIANGKFDDAERLFTEGVRLDEYDIQNLWTVAFFLDQQNQKQKAIDYFEKALALAKSDELIAAFCNNLGGAFKAMNNMPDSERYYLQSYGIYERLTQNSPQQFEPDLASLLNNFGVFYKDSDKLDKALALYYRALSLREKALLNGQMYYATEYNRVLNNLNDLLGLFAAQKDYAKALDIQTERAKSTNILRGVLENGETRAAQQYGSLSWYALLAKDYPVAEQAATDGYALDATQTWIRTNLAHALLFQNQDTASQQVYNDLKTQQNTEGVSYRTVFEEDFDALAEAGLDKMQIDKARQWVAA